MNAPSQRQQDIGMALGKIIGALAISEGHEPSWGNVHSAAICGLLIGLDIGVKDVHAARMVTIALDLAAMKSYTDSVAAEILNVVERDRATS